MLVHRAASAPAVGLALLDGHAVLAVAAPSSSTWTRSAIEVGQVLADVVGADRQLAVAAVDQDGELDARGPAEVAQRVEGGPDRAAGEEDVVDQHDRAALDALRRAGRCARGRGPGAAAGRRGTSSRRASRPGRRRPRRRRSGPRGGVPAGRRGSGCRAGPGRRRPCCARGSRGRCGSGPGRCRGPRGPAARGRLVAARGCARWGPTERPLAVLGVGVIRRPTSFPASQDGSLKDVWCRARGHRSSGGRPVRQASAAARPHELGHRDARRRGHDAIRANLLAAIAMNFSVTLRNVTQSHHDTGT